jgi:hypothetical protein
VIRVFAYVFVVLLGAGIVVPARLQPQTGDTQAPRKAAASADIFSGTVTKLTDESITVVRQVLGRDAVTRVFVRETQTKVEGKLRARARVTVQFKAVEDGGFVAVYIIVR